MNINIYYWQRYRYVQLYVFVIASRHSNWNSIAIAVHTSAGSFMIKRINNTNFTMQRFNAILLYNCYVRDDPDL